MYFENGLRKETETSNLDLSFLFTIKNVSSGYTLCHLEHCLFLLHVCFKILTRKSVVSPINWNIEKNTPVIPKGLKRGTKSINMRITYSFHFT